MKKIKVEADLTGEQITALATLHGYTQKGNGMTEEEFVQSVAHAMTVIFINEPTNQQIDTLTQTENKIQKNAATAETAENVTVVITDK